MPQKRAGSGRQKADSTGMPPLAPGERLLPDESARRASGEVSKPARERIRQAASDISRGLKDTDLHGTPSDVPGPASDPQRSAGARPIGKRGGPTGGQRRKR